MSLVLLSVPLLAAACGGSASSGGSSSSGSAASTPSPAAAAQVKSATATVAGKQETVLTDEKGMTLYYYTPDKGGKVTCTGQCAALWPPLAPSSGSSKPTGGQGVTAPLATAPNPAGGTVVTYNGWPLYTWVKDKAPGDTTGQGVQGVWFVATPNVQSGA
jgi:predicted lipoprotein with Yx(FWY)xxD motif